MFRCCKGPAFVVFFAAFCALQAPSVSHADQNSSQQQAGALDWWTPRYLVDYSLIGAGVAGYIIGGDTPARSNALIGPSYDPDDPAAIFDHPAVGATYREEGDGEMVPTRWIHYLIGAGAAFTAGLEAAEWNRGRGSANHLHDAFVGYAETVAVTAAVTEVFKPAFGRLRPDFADRARRHHCSLDSAIQLDNLCDGYRDRPLSDDPREAEELLEDGRRSFISGHSSHSFNLLGYTALLVGGRYVWGQETTERSRAVGGLSQAAMLGGATYISASRIADRRHHKTDVTAGALVGLAIANFSYWRRFDRQGQLRAANGDGRSSQITLQPATPFYGITVTFVP